MSSTAEQVWSVATREAGLKYQGEIRQFGEDWEARILRRDELLVSVKTSTRHEAVDFLDHHLKVLLEGLLR
jgi:hypothetical protein